MVPRVITITNYFHLPPSHLFPHFTLIFAKLMICVIQLLSSFFPFCYLLPSFFILSSFISSVFPESLVLGLGFVVSMSSTARSNASSSGVSRKGLLPICGCGVAMRIWIANTVENRGRRFWKCKYWGKSVSCDLFIWDDELDFESMKMVSVSETSSPGRHSSCECNCGKIFKDWESKKIGKLKVKLSDERKKMKWIQAILVFVIGVVVFQNYEFVKN